MIFLILLMATALRLISLNQSFWLDEAAQARLSSMPIFSVDYGADFQPPLFYIVSHLWMTLGVHAEWFLRLPSVLFGVATVYLTYLFFTKLFDRRVGLVSSFLLATAPYHIYYSQEFRMYALLTFLVMLSWIFLWEKRWLVYAAAILLSVFTHYFAFLAIVSQALFVIAFRRNDLTRYVRWTLAGLSPFVLWLPTLSKQIKTAQHLIAIWPGWREVAGVAFFKFPGLVLAKFTAGMTSPENRAFYALAVTIVFLIFLYALNQLIVGQKELTSMLKSMLTNLLSTLSRASQRQHQPRRLPTAAMSQYKHQPRRLKLASLRPEVALLIFFFFVPLVAASISRLWIAANTPWRVLFVLPAFYGIVAAGLNKSKQGYMRIIAISLIFMLNISFSLYYLINSKNHREDWRGAVTWTDEEVTESDVVLTESESPWVPLDWYSNKRKSYIGASTSMSITDESIKDRLGPIRDSLNEERGTRNVILYTYLFQLSDPQERVENYLTSRGFELTEEKDFRGVGIGRWYRFQLIFG